MLIQEDLNENWSLDVIKARFSATISCSMRTLYCLGDGDVFSKEGPMGIQKKVGKKLFAVAWKNGKKRILILKMSLVIGKVIGFVGKESQAQL